MCVLTHPVVSVIIPAYQSENTISRCLKSLMDQTFSDIEIIVVDDGSMDRTREIVDVLAEKDTRIRIFSQKNKGVSCARNLGIEKASGEFLMFLDADDYAEKDFVQRLFETLNDRECDLAVSSYYRRIYGWMVPVEKLVHDGTWSGKAYLTETLKDPGHHYFGVVWNKIYRRDIIRKNCIRFREDITLGEDFVFNLSYLRHARAVSVIGDKTVVYCYQSQSSLSRIQKKEIDDCRKEMANRNSIFEVYSEILKEAGLLKEYRKRMYRYWIMFEVHQRYGLKHEYRWDDSIKTVWKNEIRSNKYVREAHRIFSGREIAELYRKYALGQALRRKMKFMMSLIPVKGE